MGMQNGSLRLVITSGVLALAAATTSCTDPVKDHAIERLGPEAEGVSEGPEHRPGQPCVLCHSEGGPASKAKFVIAGTIFDSATGETGAENITVFFLDALLTPRQTVTNAAGNFFVRESEWPDLTFPFKTGVLNGKTGIKMQSTVNREGSCNFCHQLLGGDSRESVGPIFAPGAGQ